MHSLASLFGSTLFFTPFIYVSLYLLIERNLSDYTIVQFILKVFTLFCGLSIIIYACTTPLDFTVLMPSRGGAKNYVPASLFLVIAGVVTMALPFYSKYIKFSNRKSDLP